MLGTNVLHKLLKKLDISYTHFNDKLYIILNNKLYMIYVYILGRR